MPTWYEQRDLLYCLIETLDALDAILSPTNPTATTESASQWDAFTAWSIFH